ncbi:MAG: polysaccharide biosynthesis tyrosine autokinase, partial [Bacteroidales bacterium]|nr:polysaccharide biosynthesis tyrosine autokinase [Bacteroidales bacterium]
GVSQMNSKLANEIVAFRSPDLMREVVRNLKLNYRYYREGRFHETPLYAASQPIVLEVPEGSPALTCYVRPQSDSTMVIYNMEYAIENSKIKDKAVYPVTPGEPVETPYGVIYLSLNPSFSGEWNFPVIVNYTSIQAAAGACIGHLSTVAVDQKNFSDILQINYSDECVQRADDVLSSVIAVYNANWVDDRNKMAISTSMFINERLTSIEADLGHVDSDISSFKSKNLLPDVAAVSSMYMAQSTEISRAVQDIETQISTSRYIRNYLSTKVLGNQLIPVPAGLHDAGITTQINTYNSVMMQRNNLVSGSSESNPLVVEMDRNLAAMRLAICESVDNQITALQNQLQTLRRTEERATSRLADNPNQARYLLSVERRQKVMESLYLYLLQKREENELSQAFTAYNTRLITSPTAAPVPPTPNKRNILLVAFFIAIMIPLGVLYVLDYLNTTVRTRKDLDGLDVPFLGEIPFSSQGKQDKKSKKSQYRLVVKHGQRNAVNEAFRVLRTNLEFMSRNGNGNVIGFTSYNPGSGKTFVTLNVGASFALKGMKVLAIDGDFRRASLSSFAGSPSTGFADYLSGIYESIDRVIVKNVNDSGLDILPVGTIPPNPSELLGNDSFTEAIEELKNKYDYIFIDCPPVDMVADTRLISSNLSRTIFVLRSGLQEKALLADLQSRYSEEQFTGMCTLLNGVEIDSHRSRYGYAYGYSYGYGYGYGYGENHEHKHHHQE